MLTVQTEDYFSSADGKSSKTKNAFKPKNTNKSPSDKLKKDVEKTAKAGERDLKRQEKKQDRKEYRQMRKENRFKKRLDRANAKLAPGATKLTAETLPSGLEIFKGKVKALFKKKTVQTKGGKQEEVVYTKQLGNGQTIDIPAEKVTMVPTKTGEPIAYHNDDIAEAKANGAITTPNPDTGELITTYKEEDVIGVDDGNGNVDPYAPQDIEGEGKDKDGNSKEGFFTKKNLVIGGLVLLVGGLVVYFGFMRNKGGK